MTDEEKRIIANAFDVAEAAIEMLRELTVLKTACGIGAMEIISETRKKLNLPKYE